MSVSTKVAKPVLEVNGTKPTKISAINNIGYYDFTVKNYNQNNISDVPLNYTIEVISDTDNTISYKLYKDNEEINLNNKKTEPIHIEGINKKEHNYRLEVSYDKTKSKSEEDILKDIQIKVHSEQAQL